MKKFLVLLLVLFAGTLAAQNAEGIYFKFGFNSSYPTWSNYNRMLQEYSELRPWLTEKPALGKAFAGWNIGYGVSGERFYGEMLYSSQRSVMRFAGTDSSGTAQSGAYLLVGRGFILNGGLKLINSEAFRFALFAGPCFNTVAFRNTASSPQEKFLSLLMIPIFFTNKKHHEVGSNSYLGLNAGASIQIGGKWGASIEPFYVLPFWKSDIKEIRNDLNPLTTSAYPDSDFKASLGYWGIRYCMFVGTGG